MDKFFDHTPNCFYFAAKQYIFYMLEKYTATVEDLSLPDPRPRKVIIGTHVLH